MDSAVNPLARLSFPLGADHSDKHSTFEHPVRTESPLKRPTAQKFMGFTDDLKPACDDVAHTLYERRGKVSSEKNNKTFEKVPCFRFASHFTESSLW